MFIKKFLNCFCFALPSRVETSVSVIHSLLMAKSEFISEAEAKGVASAAKNGKRKTKNEKLKTTNGMWHK